MLTLSELRFMDPDPTFHRKEQGGWICCCRGPILDPRNPARSMVCCGNYEWLGPAATTEGIS